jgi:hypothetical protein
MEQPPVGRYLWHHFSFDPSFDRHSASSYRAEHSIGEALSTPGLEMP